MKNNEKTGYKDIRIVLRLLDPFKEIDDALGRDDYFGAFALAVAYFEYYAFTKLKVHFHGKVSEAKLERLSATELAILLFCSGMTDQPTYANMIEVIKQRNELVHPKEEITKKYELDKSYVDLLLEKAKKCIEVLSRMPL